MAPGAEDRGAAGGSPIADRLFGKAPEAGQQGHDPHDLAQDHHTGSPSLAEKLKGRLDSKVADRARAFVAELRSGRVMTLAEELAALASFLDDVQAAAAAKVDQPGPIDPVQAP